MTPHHLFSADHFHTRVPHLALDPHPPFTRDGLAPPPPTPTAPACPHKAGVTFHRHTQSNLYCETFPKPRGQALPPPPLPLRHSQDSQGLPARMCHILTGFSTISLRLLLPASGPVHTPSLVVSIHLPSGLASLQHFSWGTASLNA